MIAEVVISTGLPPEAFGVPSSERLGAAIFDVLTGRRIEVNHAANIERFRGA